MSSSEEEFQEPEDQHSDEERVIIFSNNIITKIYSKLFNFTDPNKIGTFRHVI